MNSKILASLLMLPLLLMPIASSYAMSSEYMPMKDKSSIKKNIPMGSSMEKIRHMGQTKIENPYFFQIDDTTVKIKRGTVTISGHGVYNPDQDVISAWGKYSISIGSRELAGSWTAANLVSGKGNPYGVDSDESHVHFIGKTLSLKDPKYTGNNAKRESVMRGSHQIWISANAEEGKLCVYGSYVGAPSPRNSCVETDTISITK
ncbi:MAG TPA: hypothetical protein VD699_02810 [Nitrosopumilaceae archaeon]|nr:hypothetical protein [Nitrosopumilaceae archaeon]HXV38489.1 hypothetical protein [Nitrosopumilaceae archaeon]